MKAYESLVLSTHLRIKSFYHRALIIAIYLTVFWFLLPGMLYSIGFKMDKLVSIDLNIPESAGWMLFIAGAVIMSFAIGQLKFQGKGLPISHLAPENFVATGFYKYFRHPVYIGYTLSFAGISILINSYMSLVFSTAILLFGWIGYAYFYEEKVLLSRFGTVYEKYMASTPILVPKQISLYAGSLIKPVMERTLFVLNKLANQTVLFRRGNVVFVTYGLLMSIGSVLAFTFTSYILISQSFTESEVSILLIGWGASSAVCGRIFWWIGHIHHLIKEPFFGLRKVGFVSWGGVTGLFVFSSLFSLFTGHSFYIITDMFLRGMFLAYAIGRLGCLTYGCCYGIKACKNGIYYDNPDAKALRENNNIKILRYPVQFFSFLQGITLFTILNTLTFLNPPPGLITAIAFMLYPVGRAFIEFLRDRKKRFMNLITDGHLGCFIMFAAGYVILQLIPSAIAGNGYSQWSLYSLTNVIPVLPTILFMTFLIFAVMGFHWKKVGQW